MESVYASTFTYEFEPEQHPRSLILHDTPAPHFILWINEKFLPQLRMGWVSSIQF